MQGYYTIKELALKLKVSTRTVLREIDRGKIKVSKVGRKFLVSEDQLTQYLKTVKIDFSSHIHDFTHAKKPEMIELLQRLVSQSSVSDSDGEEKLAHLIKSELEKFGIRSVINGKNEAVTVRGTFGYADSGILLDCPLDTTPVGDLNYWDYPPYDAVIKGYRMYGRGTADSKAGIVSMIYAVLALKDIINEERIRVELVFDGGEQNGAYYGMKHTLLKGLPVKCGIIGYAGTQEELAIGARGYHRFIFKTHGKAEHTGSKSKIGINAISAMVKFIEEMEKTKFPKPWNNYFHFGSKLTFAKIIGGRAINIVPDECEAELDVRTTPEIRKKDVEEIIDRLIDKIKKDNKEFKIDYIYNVGQEGYLLDESEKIVQDLLLSIEGINNFKPEIVVNGPAHIGNLLYECGIPIVVWGPEGGNVHSYNEYVEIDSIPKTAEIYANTILRYFGIGTE